MFTCFYSMPPAQLFQHRAQAQHKPYWCSTQWAGPNLEYIWKSKESECFLAQCIFRDFISHRFVISSCAVLDVPELLPPASMVGLTEDLPSLLDTMGGPGVPSHSWAFPGSLEEAVPWCPLSLFSSFGSGSVLWLLIFSSSSGSTKYTSAHFIIE